MGVLDIWIVPGCITEYQSGECTKIPYMSRSQSVV
jgi:hypothetical protein